MAESFRPAAGAPPLAMGLGACLAVAIAAASMSPAPGSLAGGPVGSIDGGAGAASDAAAAQLTPQLHLPLLLGHLGEPLAYPHPDLPGQVASALEAFVRAYPPADIFPGYRPSSGGPTPANVAANLEAACHDFPDLPDIYGPGSHRAACYQWTADYLALYHAVLAEWQAHRPEPALQLRPGNAPATPVSIAPLPLTRAVDASSLGARGERGVSGIVSDGTYDHDRMWAELYLDASMDYLAPFVYGPESSPSGTSYRDTLAAASQNTLRAIDLVITVDLLRRSGALASDRQARAEELLSGIARAWYASFYSTGIHPSHGVALTTRTSDQATAYTLGGRQVVSAASHTFKWDADKGNTPAEETAWMGAGVMLASRALGSRLADGQALQAAGQHYVDFALAYNRPDAIHGGEVRTLNAETSEGPYGQRRYWLENHAPDVPSVPYLAATWHSVGAALLAAPEGGQRVWPGLIPNREQWRVLTASAEATLQPRDGRLLVDLAEGHAATFDLDGLPDWTMPCGTYVAGTHYVRQGTHEDGTGRYVSEIGHGGGQDLLMIGWPMLRLAAWQGDAHTYQLWEERLEGAAAELRSNPPDLEWTRCKVARYVSDNSAYHWSRVVATYCVRLLGAAGYEVAAWH